MNNKIPDKCQDCTHLKKKEEHYCNEEYWDNHLGMNGIPATDEIADNCKCNCVDHLCNVEVEYCNAQIRTARLQKKNILENSDELVQAYYHIDDIIKESNYSFNVKQVLVYYEEKTIHGENRLPASIHSIIGCSSGSLKTLYDAGYRG